MYGGYGLFVRVVGRGLKCDQCVCVTKEIEIKIEGGRILEIPWLCC